MANYPYELAQDAAYQSHTSRLNEFWSLPKPAQRLNTYNNNNNNNNNNMYSPRYFAADQMSRRRDYGSETKVVGT